MPQSNPHSYSIKQIFVEKQVFSVIKQSDDEEDTQIEQTKEGSLVATKKRSGAAV